MSLTPFDRTAFEREGYWIWEGILTDAGRRQWTDSLRKLQELNDRVLVDTDWGAIDFESRGLPPPPPDQITAEFLNSCCGGSERMPGFLRTAECRGYMHDHGLFGPSPALVTRGFESQGVMPEYFPFGYDEFILDLITAHPQMMELFGKLLGDRFVIDHCFALNRTSGSGRTWHAHQYRADNTRSRTPLGRARRSLRSSSSSSVYGHCAIPKVRLLRIAVNWPSFPAPIYTGFHSCGTRRDRMMMHPCKPGG